MHEMADAPVMTLAEMRQQFKGEWVLILDYEIDPETHDVSRGRVAAHSVERHVVDKAGDLLPNPVRAAYHCFREPGEGTTLVL